MRTAIVGTAMLWIGCAGSAASQQGPTEVVLPEASASTTSSPPERAEPTPTEPSALDRARIASTGPTLELLRMGAELWRATHDDVCPTVEQLERDRVLDPKSAVRNDPWGTAIAIQCSDEQVSVASAGPDKKFGTADDIVSVSR